MKIAKGLKGCGEMRIRFLGTAAAEGWPAVFCQCENCRRARATGGKNVRTRASAMINDDLKVDLPPDTYYHVIKYGLELAKVEHLLVTHTHQDHFYFEELAMRRKPFAEILDAGVLNVYGNGEVYNRVRGLDEVAEGSLLKAKVVEPFRWFNAGKYEVMPLLADHSSTERCLIYVISDRRNTILYGHDSGWFPSTTWDRLGELELDLVIADCTNGALSAMRYHMGIDGVLNMKEEMKNRGIAGNETMFVATHFSHNGGLLHEELEERLNPNGVSVAYDGLVIEL